MRLEEFIALNKSKGKHWFNKDTMRFFRSRVTNWDFISGYFITSERREWNTPRCYTIRKADFETGDVATVSEFQEYAHLNTAKRHLLKYLRGRR